MTYVIVPVRAYTDRQVNTALGNFAQMVKAALDTAMTDGTQANWLTVNMAHYYSVKRAQ